MYEKGGENDSVWLKSEFYLAPDGALQNSPNSRSYVWL